MDKFDLRTILFGQVYDYLEKNPNKLTKEQQKKLLDAVTELTKTMKKVECKELIDFLQHIGAIDNTEKNISPNV